MDTGMGLEPERGFIRERKLKERSSVFYGSPSMFAVLN